MFHECNFYPELSMNLNLNLYNFSWARSKGKEHFKCHIAHFQANSALLTKKGTLTGQQSTYCAMCAQCMLLKHSL